jgi:D-alanyl-D-alanine carboxypeptidase (penicillin-binding protein 5/6)
MRASTLALLAWLLALAGATATAQTPPNRYPDVARAYWVELDGRPLWAGHTSERLPMASLTKLMTALVISEQADLDGVVTIDRDARAETGTRIGLRLGERLRAGDLLAAALLGSANDACRALADWHGGDQAGFVALMNRRAAQLGMRDTHFADACGHDAPGQYSSARDLAVLARAALARKEIATAARSSEFRFRTLAGRDYRVRNTNALIGRYEGARGLKTGYTPGAGRCLIAVADRDGHEVLAVLLHAPERWWDSVGLLERAFDEARRRPAQ